MKKLIGQSTRFSAQRGISYVTLVFFGTLFFCVGFYASNVLPIMYGFWELDNHMQTIIHLADQLTDQDIRNRLRTTIREQKIPLKPEEIYIYREKNHMIISAKYKQVFKVEFQGKEYWRQEFKFEPYGEGNF